MTAMPATEPALLARRRRRDMLESVCAEIEQKIIEKGVYYQPDRPTHFAWEGPGYAVQAYGYRDLRMALDMEHVTATVFSRALGRLMYKHGRVVRDHIKGRRHFKRLGTENLRSTSA